MILYIITEEGESPFKKLNMHKDKWDYYYMGINPPVLYDEAGIPRDFGPLSSLTVKQKPMSIITKDGKWHNFGRKDKSWRDVLGKEGYIHVIDYKEV